MIIIKFICSFARDTCKAKFNLHKVGAEEAQKRNPERYGKQTWKRAQTLQRNKQIAVAPAESLNETDRFKRLHGVL